VPGIGKKTAERLLLELKGKLGDALAVPAAVHGDAHGAPRADQRVRGMQRGGKTVDPFAHQG
jgi:Holliday junction resolvasome RuvABC DNA-binding subunit